MLNRRPINLSLPLCLAILLVSGCHNSQPAAANSSSEAANVAQAATPAPAQSPSPPHPEAATVTPPTDTAELRQVVARIYKNAVTVETTRPDAFMTGDFNGDNSQDIAVVVRPNKSMLSEINGEFANWILEDPQQLWLLNVHKSVEPNQPKPLPVPVRQNETLLAIIHGYQETGWRNPKASQTYLLKNVVGDHMQAQTARSLLNQPVEEGQGLPPLRGDVIDETLSGTPGYIYWTGAKYSWFPKEEHGEQ